MDTSGTVDVKVIEERLDHVIKRLDEFVDLAKDQDKKISQAKGLAVSLNRQLEERVRNLERSQARFMGQIALGALVAAPVLAVLAQVLASKL